MNSLARVGTIVGLLVAGCSSSTSVVHSCAEATPALAGATCSGFTDCPFACPYAYSCTGGVLHAIERSIACDAGLPDDSGAHEDAAPADAGIDAGPCAPTPPATGTPCHVSSECDPTRFEMCYAPGASTGCGPCVPAMRTCATDADCAATDFCESYVDPCTHVGFCGTGTDPTSTRCVPRCTIDPSTGTSSCGEGFTCGSDGRCTAIPCVSGYACPTYTHCSDVAGGDAHGCVRDSCAFDSDCGCGAACLGGACYDTLGTCMTPAA